MASYEKYGCGRYELRVDDDRYDFHGRYRSDSRKELEEKQKARGGEIVDLQFEAELMGCDYSPEPSDLHQFGAGYDNA